MTGRSTVHATFVIERSYDATPARVFKAFADPKAKAMWFGGGQHGAWTPIRNEFDFRPGGRERVAGRWKNGTVSDFDCVYMDIVADARIVYAYNMFVNDKKISVSLTTVDIKPEGKGTHLTFTEQGAFLDGYDDAGSRESGTKGLMDSLGESLKHAP